MSLMHGTNMKTDNNIKKPRSVGIATRYRLDDPWIGPGGREIFRALPDLSCGPSSLL